EVEIRNVADIAATLDAEAHSHCERLANINLQGCPSALVDDFAIEQLHVVIADHLALAGKIGATAELAIATEIFQDDFRRRALFANLPLVQEDATVAQRGDGLHAVADEQYRPAAGADVLHLAEALLLELGITDRQHLVDD